MVKTFQDFFMDKGIQIYQIANHARPRIYPARDRYLHGIIMAMAMRIVAFAVNGLVLRCSHCVAMQPMRR